MEGEIGQKGAAVGQRRSSVNPRPLRPAGGADHGAAAGARRFLHAALGAERRHRGALRLPSRERRHEGGLRDARLRLGGERHRGAFCRPSFGLVWFLVHF